MYKCYVSTVGNIDRHQYAPVSNPEWIEADTLQDLREKVEEYKYEWNIGGGNWKDPIVYEVHGRAGKRIGFLSYNLRLWVKDGIEYKENQQQEVVRR